MEEGQSNHLMEPRFEKEYSERIVEGARRALIDIMQVLASFGECLVLVGGWVPELLIPNTEEPHIGSIDVDLALNTEKLMDGRYAQMLEHLLNTKRYRQSEKNFQLQTEVDLKDGGEPILVDIDFMGAADADTEKNKPKDAYDICYCLMNYAGGIPELAKAWKKRLNAGLKETKLATEYLREKFQSVNAYGTQQVVEFHNSNNPEEQEIQARHSYELVRTFLEQVEQ